MNTKYQNLDYKICKLIIVFLLINFSNCPPPPPEPVKKVILKVEDCSSSLIDGQECGIGQEIGSVSLENMESETQIRVLDHEFLPLASLLITGKAKLEIRKTCTIKECFVVFYLLSGKMFITNENLKGDKSYINFTFASSFFAVHPKGDYSVLLKEDGKILNSQGNSSVRYAFSKELELTHFEEIHKKMRQDCELSKPNLDRYDKGLSLYTVKNAEKLSSLNEYFNDLGKIKCKENL